MLCVDYFNIFLSTEIIINFNQSMYTVDENTGALQPILMLTNPSSTKLKITVLSTDGNATGE